MSVRTIDTKHTIAGMHPRTPNRGWHGAPPMSDYDPRYLAGVLLFNAGDYFEAHEVWEDLWAEGHGDEPPLLPGADPGRRRAVPLRQRQPRRGGKLYHSSRDYIAGLAADVHGAGRREFWRQMAECFAPMLGARRPTARARPDPEHVPAIALDPPPEAWPDPEDYFPEDEGCQPPRDPARSDSFPPDEFAGTARLFPLPNLVLFPHVVQPLHIFEPRYRQLMADALADDRLIAMALLRPGWEEDYHRKPADPPGRLPGPDPQRGEAGRRPLQPAAARPEPGPGRRGADDRPAVPRGARGAAGGRAGRREAEEPRCGRS